MQTGVANYETSWIANGLTWSNNWALGCRLLVSSFVEDYNNHMELLMYDDTKRSLVSLATSEHCYPPTKVIFHPQKEPGASTPDLFASTADYLRIWEIQPQPDRTSKIVSKHCLNNSKMHEFCAPLTSCDWNADDPKLIITSSIDTTVSVWDVETQQPTTQLVAHDKEVFDVGFAKSTHVFASVSADGSLRVFDLRQMEHCTIVYESPEAKPLLRLSWNKLNTTYIATFSLDSQEVIVVDVRYPSAPACILSNHTSAINSIGWAPHSSTHLCSAGEDSRALIWDVGDTPSSTANCIMMYEAGAEINTIAWSPLKDDLIAITYGKRVEVLSI